MDYKFKNKAALLFLGMLLFLYSCISPKRGELSPENKTPVYSVAVEDGTEAALIEQEMKLQVVKVSGGRIYYYDEGDKYSQQLKQIGYGQAQKEDLYQVYKKYQKLLLKGVKDSVTVLRKKFNEMQVLIINQEKDHIVVFGTLAALNELIKQGYQMQKMDYELRPREVEIIVNKREDVQKVSEIGIDIHSAALSRQERGILIHGAAFDNQIEEVKAAGFTVTIVKQRF